MTTVHKTGAIPVEARVALFQMKKLTRTITGAQMASGAVKIEKIVLDAAGMDGSGQGLLTISLSAKQAIQTAESLSAGQEEYRTLMERKITVVTDVGTVRVVEGSDYYLDYRLDVPAIRDGQTLPISPFNFTDGSFPLLPHSLDTDVPLAMDLAMELILKPTRKYVPDRDFIRELRKAAMPMPGGWRMILSIDGRLSGPNPLMALRGAIPGDAAKEIELEEKRTRVMSVRYYRHFSPEDRTSSRGRSVRKK